MHHEVGGYVHIRDSADERHAMLLQLVSHSWEAPDTMMGTEMRSFARVVHSLTVE